MATTAKRSPPLRHRGAGAGGLASWLELRGALTTRGSPQRAPRQRRLPVATTAKRSPPLRHRSAGADGLTSGSSSEEPSPAPRSPRTRECSYRTTQPSAARTTGVTTGRDPVTIMKREVAFEKAPGSVVQVHRRSSRAGIRQVLTGRTRAPPFPAESAFSWSSQPQDLVLQTLAVRSAERKLRVPFPASSHSPAVPTRLGAVRRPPASEELQPASCHPRATPAKERPADSGPGLVFGGTASARCLESNHPPAVPPCRRVTWKTTFGREALTCELPPPIHPC